MQTAGVLAIEGAMRWYDEERARGGSINGGVLQNAIRDGGMPGYGLPAPEIACSWNAALAEEWEPLAEQLRAALGELTFEVWLAKAHPHERTAFGWLLGAPPTIAAWVPSRYGQTLAHVCGERARIVACEQPGGFR